MSVPTTTMRIDPELKDEANKVLGELGLSLSGAVTIFLKAVVREQGLPIDIEHQVGQNRREQPIEGVSSP